MDLKLVLILDKDYYTELLICDESEEELLDRFDSQLSEGEIISYQIFSQEDLEDIDLEKVRLWEKELYWIVYYCDWFADSDCDIEWLNFFYSEEEAKEKLKEYVDYFLKNNWDENHRDEEHYKLFSSKQNFWEPYQIIYY